MISFLYFLTIKLNIKKNLPEINSFGICFFPEVVTLYIVKSSILTITQDVINFEKFSKTLFVIGELSIGGVVVPPTGIPVRFVGAVTLFGVLPNGAWDGGLLGLLKFKRASLNVFNDCSNHKAGGIAASLYLK